MRKKKLKLSRNNRNCLLTTHAVVAATTSAMFWWFSFSSNLNKSAREYNLQLLQIIVTAINTATMNCWCESKFEVSFPFSSRFNPQQWRKLRNSNKLFCRIDKIYIERWKMRRSKSLEGEKFFLDVDAQGVLNNLNWHPSLRHSSWKFM